MTDDLSTHTHVDHQDFLLNFYFIIFLFLNRPVYVAVLFLLRFLELVNDAMGNNFMHKNSLPFPIHSRLVSAWPVMANVLAANDACTFGLLKCNT